jgi:GT2 family glycosyltransferase
MIPFALDRNLGAAYNEEMARLPDGDWALFIDHDVIPGLTREWVPLVYECIQFKPDAGAFVAVTNRIDAVWQRAPEVDPNNHDVLYHTRAALARRARRSLLDITDTKGFGGVMFALSKSAWQAAGGFADGLLCVDHSIFFGLRRVGYRIFLMEHVYVYHRRRAEIGPLPTDTPRVEACPCRGHEPMPTERLPLPEVPV